MSAGFVMTLAEIAAALDGLLIGTPSITVRGVSTDSRKELAGTLFVALAGDRFDAHDYLGDVAASGAAAALVAADRVASLPPQLTLPLIAVDDTRVAIGRLAAAWRRRFVLSLVGVTGSNGKTTTKEMLSAIFAATARRIGLGAGAVLATRGNLNNDIGVPLTLFALDAATRYAVIEMGMNHPGEIVSLARMAAPTVALVTNAQRAHLEGLGSVAAVAREKASIYSALKADGVAVVNADDPHADLFRAAAGRGRVVNASLDGSGDVVGRYRPALSGSIVEISDGSGTVAVELPLLGRHNARNAVVATAAARAAGATLADAAAGLRAMTNVGGRLRRSLAAGGALLLDDSYNANPDSMRAAIDVLAEMPGTRILIAGDMGEVGDDRLALHREIGAYALDAGIDGLYGVGEAMREAVSAFGAPARHFATAEELVAAIRPQLDASVSLLVKGSRFMRMERIVAALAGEAAANSNGKAG